MEDLPYTQTHEGEEHEPSKALHVMVRQDLSGGRASCAHKYEGEDVRFMLVNLPSRFLGWSSSSTISLASPSSLRISVSIPERNPRLALALVGVCEWRE